MTTCMWKRLLKVMNWPTNLSPDSSVQHVSTHCFGFLAHRVTVFVHSHLSHITFLLQQTAELKEVCCNTTPNYLQVKCQYWVYSLVCGYELVQLDMHVVASFLLEMAYSKNHSNIEPTEIPESMESHILSLSWNMTAAERWMWAWWSQGID